MPRNVALAGRFAGRASPVISSSVSAFVLTVSSGSSTRANSHARPPSQVSGITVSGARRGSGCTMSRPRSHSIARCAAAASGLTAMRQTVRCSSGSATPVSPTAAVPTSSASSARSAVSNASYSTSPAGPIVIGCGRPVALPATSSCIRQGLSTAARVSVEAVTSSRNTIVPPARRPSTSSSASARTAGSTSRRRSSRSVAHTGCRPEPRRATAVVAVACTRTGPRTRGRSSTSSPSSGAEGSPFAVSVASSASASSAGTMSSETGVWSWRLENSPRRSTSRIVAASAAHGLPARPRGVVLRLSSVMPPRRPAESSSSTSCVSPVPSVTLARTCPTRGHEIRTAVAALAVAMSAASNW